MANVIITNTTSENYPPLLELLDFSERFGHSFYFLNLKYEAIKKKSNSDFLQNYYHKRNYWINYLNLLGTNEDPESHINNLFINIEKAIDKIKPKVACVFGGRFGYTAAILAEICNQKKIKIFFSENTPIPGSFYIQDFPRFEFIKNVGKISSKIIEEQHQVYLKRGQEILQNIRKELPKRHVFSQNIIDKELLIRKNKKVLILGADLEGHALYPSNLEYRSKTFPLFEDIGHMINYINQIDNIDIWFKPHPAIGFDNYYSNIIQTENLKIFDGSNFDPNILIKNADIIISFLSKLEINALALEKTIIYPGIGWFWSQGYTYDCNSKEEIVKSIKNIINGENKTENTKDVNMFISWLEKESVNFYNFTTKEKLTNKYEQVVKFFNLLGLEVKNEANYNKNSIRKLRLNYFYEFGWKKPENKIKIYFLKFFKIQNYFKLIKRIFRAYINVK